MYLYSLRISLPIRGCAGACEVAKYLIEKSGHRGNIASLPEPSELNSNLFHYAAFAASNADELVTILSNFDSGTDLICAPDQDGKLREFKIPSTHALIAVYFGLTLIWNLQLFIFGRLY